MIHTTTETNRIPQTKIKRWDQISVRTHFEVPGIIMYSEYHMLNESQQKPKPRRQHSTRKKKKGYKWCLNRNRKRERKERIQKSQHNKVCMGWCGERVVTVCVVFTLNRSFYSTTSVHPVSVLTFHPREIQILWSQTETDKNKNNRN